MRYSFSNGTQTPDYFKKINKRGLGDTANDMAIYGSKTLCCCQCFQPNRSDWFKTGTSLKQIGMLTENGSSRQPRYITFFENKVMSAHLTEPLLALIPQALLLKR